ncbi:MAG: cytochrome c oxidase subunit 3 [Acidobacteriota bacterium]|nr:cytochrome c oxidase subunit 3 [Acidobacteriota bacterium]
MTAPRTLDVAHLQPYSISSKSPLWWGQLMMCFIEASMFCMLIAIYFYLRLSVDMWPPPGTQLPHLTLPTLALIPLLLSAIGSYWASEAAKKNSRSGMLKGMILNVVLGALFLALRFAEMKTLNFNWATDVHGSIVWSMLFLHTLDSVGDLFYTVVLIYAIASGRYGQKQRLGVHADSVVWYFIVGIWIPMYVVIYWGPRIVGAP